MDMTLYGVVQRNKTKHVNKNTLTNSESIVTHRMGIVIISWREWCERGRYS